MPRSAAYRAIESHSPQQQQKYINVYAQTFGICWRHNQATWYASQHKSVPVPSQDKLGRLRGRKGIRRNMGGLGVGAPLVSVGVASTGASAYIILPGGIMGVGAPLVRMGWRPPRLSVSLPPLSSPAPQKSRRFS